MDKIFIQYLAQQSAQAPVTTTAPAADKPHESHEGPGGIFGSLSTVLMLGFMFVFMWFFVIRPQRKEEKRKKEMLNALNKGDAVITTSGILGTIATLKDETVILKVGDGTKMEFLRSAVGSVRNPGKGEKSEGKSGKSDKE